MNILIIPSWYPFDGNNLGIFIRDQAFALSENYPHHNFFISWWGQEKNKLNPKNVMASFSTSSIQESILRENLFLIKNEKVIFPRRLGGLKSQYKANEEIIDFINSKYGKIDILHPHVLWPAGLIASKIKDNYKIPFVLTEHMSPFPFPHLMKGDKLEPNLDDALKNADRILSVSSYQKKEIEKFSRNIDVIPNILPFDICEDEKKSVNSRVTEVLVVGGLNEQKGIDLLLNALSRINSKYKECINVTIVGEGELRQNLVNQCVELQLDDIVKFVGKKSRVELQKLYKECDFFSLTSRHESFGLVYIEAMSFGKPVIATSTGGAKEFVNEKVGVLIDPNDINQIASKLEWMIENYLQFDPNEIKSHVDRHFSKRVITKKIMEIYNEVLGNLNE